ncbi:MAG: hypothetical protein WC763_04300 [Candidatus Paceibacterota bacterium]|jgi:hypothetical protein
MILIGVCLLIPLLLFAPAYWRLDAFCKYVGYQSFINFILITQESTRWERAKEKLKEKAHLMTYQGIRAIEAVEREHGAFRETECLKAQIHRTRKAVENRSRLEIIPVGNTSLLRIKGESGRKIKTFLVDWNRFDRMAELVNAHLGE